MILFGYFAKNPIVDIGILQTLNRNRVVDGNIPMLQRMYKKRLTGYKAIGYEVLEKSSSKMTTFIQKNISDIEV